MKPRKSLFALAILPTLLSVSITWAQTQPPPTFTPLPILPPLPQTTAVPTGQPTAQASVTVLPTQLPAPATFADEAFRATWARTDQLVAEGTVRRSFYWGPQPNTGGLQEDYAEGSGGKHLVQYFDKSRMEINDPKADKKNPFFVTNGLLAQEMITGKMQVGNTQFVDRFSAQIPLASDVDDTQAPTYASFRDARRSQSTNRVNSVVNTSIDRNGIITTTTAFNSYGVKYAYFEATTKHNIPDIFWTFLNDSGPVIITSTGTPVVRHARLTDPYFYATGYPITEAYWAKVKIAGITGVDVLVQPYERRVLTYVPSLPEGFKVQVGNIGQHYYDWRYKNAGNLADVPTSCGNFLYKTGGIGKVWNENPAARRQLGCPADTGGISVTIAQQTFEHGQMFDVITPATSGQPTQKTIYVLYEDGTLQSFPDTYVDGSPEPTPAELPPTGFITPLRGFGKVWRDNPTVKQRLGSAAQAEQVYSASLYMPFDRGISLTPNSGQSQIYVLYDDRGLSYKDANKWVVYTGQ